MTMRDLKKFDGGPPGNEYVRFRGAEVYLRLSRWRFIEGQTRVMVDLANVSRRRRAWNIRSDPKAVAINKDRALISHVEHGRSGLLHNALAKIARELHVSTGYLLGLTGDPTPDSELSQRLT